MADSIARSTKFGRIQVAERPSLRTLHLYQGEQLNEVSWTSDVPCLDQEDFSEQGIVVSSFVPGAPADCDALGSCTCNAFTRHLGERLKQSGIVLGDASIAASGFPVTFTLSGTDPAVDEKFAIELYHQVTDQTGDPSQEWPPSDCGSTELFVMEYAERLGLIKAHKTAANVDGMLSLLQVGSVAMGSPWFNAWMQPDSQGFVDGDGSREALEAAIKSGVAGGHETVHHELVQVAQTTNGVIEYDKTITEVWNSWDPAWGVNGGCYRIHASTLQMLGGNCDYKQALEADLP